MNPLATRLVRAAGGVSKFLAYARSSTNEKVVSLCGVYDSLSPSDRKALMLDDLCEKSDISFKELLSEVTAEAFEHNANLSTLIAAVSHPKIVEKTVHFAEKADGFKDREMLHKHAKFLPIPKGSTTNIGFSALMSSGAGLPGAHTSQIEGELPDDAMGDLPSFENDMINVHRAVRGELPPAQEEK